MVVVSSPAGLVLDGPVFTVIFGIVHVQSNEQSGVSFSFLHKVWGKMRLGAQVRIRVQSMWQSRGSGGMLPREILILDLSLDAIWWNLGLFSHKHLLCH